MDKNIGALLRDDCQTVKVTFTKGEREYTYVANRAMGLQVGDLAVVVVGGNSKDAGYKVVEVTWVDESLEIEPGEDTQYKWVVNRVDLSGHRADEERNKALAKAVATHYRANARRQFADLILASLPSDERNALLGG